MALGGFNNLVTFMMFVPLNLHLQNFAINCVRGSRLKLKFIKVVRKPNFLDNLN